MRKRAIAHFCVLLSLFLSASGLKAEEINSGEIKEIDSNQAIDSITNYGTLNILEAGTLNTNSLLNGYEATNNGNIIANTIQNLKGANMFNNKELSTNSFINQTLANFENSGKMDTQGNTTNYGTFVNQGELNVNSGILNNAGIFINSGQNASLNTDTVVNTQYFGVTNGANISIGNLESYGGDIEITNNSTLTLNSQSSDIWGNITVNAGQNTLSSINNTCNIIDAVNVGNLSSNTVLNLNNINVTKDAITNVHYQSQLVLNNSNRTLYNKDSMSGYLIINDNSSLTLDNFTLISGNESTLSGSNKPYYLQNGGEILLNNNSTLEIQNLDSIKNGSILVDQTSNFIINSSKNSSLTLQNLELAGNLHSMNSYNETFNVHNLILSETSQNNPAKFTIDINARSNNENSSDKFVGNTISNGYIEISDWSLNGDTLGYDAPIDRNISLGPIFDYKNISEADLKISITKKEVFTPIGWYQLNAQGAGNYSLNLTQLNPQVYRGQMTTLAQWMNQLAIDDMLFNHSMLLPSIKENDVDLVMANRYASTDPLFAPYQYSRKNGGLWYKMYGTFETMQMSQGLGNVGNNAYGSIIGADFGLKELKHGWKFMPTAYIGYNGAHQYYSGLGAYQNGGQAGFLGTWYKNNFIIGGLLYGGVYQNSMDVAGRTDNTFNYFAGAATKLAYNWRFHKDWVLQPNLFLAYNFFGQQNWHSDFGQMGMMSGILNGINLAPGLNLIWEKETFSIYATLQYMYNLNGAVGGRAGNVGLPNLHMDRGYIQYGIGFTKRFTDRFSGYFQTVFRNVGRTGVGFQMGFNILLGK